MIKRRIDEKKNFEYYNKFSLYDLRIYARKIGVKSVTSKKKNDLINAIIEVESGVVKAYFSKRGRPSLALYEDIKENKCIDINKIDEIIEKFRNELIEYLKNNNTL